MLPPDVIDGIGVRLAGIFSQVEAELLDVLVELIASGEAMTQEGFTALVLLAQTKAPELREAIERHREEIDDAVYEECERYLQMSDDADRAVAGGGRIWPQQLPAVAASVGRWAEAVELGMPEAAQTAFASACEEAITKVSLGTMTLEAATRKAVRELEGKGVDVVQWSKDGETTYSMKPEAAVRQQVRTQVNKACEDMTMQRMEETGLDLVEVSSHVGARPSHREWEGRCYSLTGRQVIDGTVYEDYYEACRVGNLADGIYGYNCRHSVMPYIHGLPRAYGPEPSHPSGLSSAEVYDLTQGQRARERGIREAKRQLRGAERLYEEKPTPENALELQRARDRLARRQEGMRDYIEQANSRGKAPVLTRDPQREWAGDMPKRARSVAVGNGEYKTIMPLDELIEKCVKAEERVFDDGELYDVYMQAKDKIKRYPDVYDVCMHGDEESCRLFGVRTDPATLVKIIQMRDDYNGEVIRLISCATGKRDASGACFAQRVAEEAGVPVIAPCDDAVLEVGGRIRIDGQGDIGGWNFFGDDDGSGA